MVSSFLAACSVSTPLSVTSTGDGPSRGTAISLSKDEADTALRERFRTALAKAFADSASKLSEEAPVFAEFSIVQTDARNGTVAGDGTTADETDAINWLSNPRRKRDFDKCEAQRLRASLILYDRASGEIIYRGSGHAIECDFSDRDLAAMAKALVGDALPDQ